jgi:hypothetical protein
MPCAAVQGGMSPRVGRFEVFTRAGVRHEATNTGEIVGQEAVVVRHPRRIRGVIRLSASEAMRASRRCFP